MAASSCSIKQCAQPLMLNRRSLHNSRRTQIQTPYDAPCRGQQFQRSKARAGSDSPQVQIEKMQQKSSEQLEDALDGVEDNLDSKIAEQLKGLVGEHHFDDEQKKVFQYLFCQMRRCAQGLFVLAGIVVLSVAQQVWEGESHPIPGISLRGVAVSRLSHALNAILVAALLWAGAVSFKKVFQNEENQLAYAIQGIIQLSIIFMQIAPITISFAVVNIVEAAVRWPQVASLVAGGVALTTIVRASSLAVLLKRYTPGQEGCAKVMLALRKGWRGLTDFPWFPDRAALVVSAGLLLPYSTPDFATSVSKAEDAEELAEGGPDAKQQAEDGAQPDNGSKHSSKNNNQGKEGSQKGENQEESQQGAESEGKGDCEYEFTRWEERVLEVVMDAMRMSALALALQALSSVMLGVAVGVTSNWWSARTYFMNDLVDQSLRALLLFASAGCFRRIPETEGKDITHLLEGLGKDHGLGQLFNRMQKLAWGMATFKGIFLVLPYLAKTAAWQKFKSFLVKLVVEYIPKGGKLTAAAGL